MKTLPACLLFLSLGAACHTTERFVAVPPDLDLATTPEKTIAMTAQRYHFDPDVVRVPQGTLVTLEITALDGEHGFALEAFGIDVELERGQTERVQFFAAERGEYEFECSHFCGIGHLGMDGKVVVE